MTQTHTYATLDKEHIEKIKALAEAFVRLPDDKLIFTALAAIIGHLDKIPIGVRVPLQTALTQRATKK